MILTSYKRKTCLVYQDDKIILSWNLDDHIRQVDDFLSTSAKAGVTLEINKCHFFQPRVEYLGHIFRPGKLEIDKTNVESF